MQTGHRFSFPLVPKLQLGNEGKRAPQEWRRVTLLSLQSSTTIGVWFWLGVPFVLVLSEAVLVLLLDSRDALGSELLRAMSRKLLLLVESDVCCCEVFEYEYRPAD